MKYLDYKGYTGTIEYSSEDKLLYGKLIGIKGLISYEGKTGEELEIDFKAAIDDYLTDCKERGIKAEKPFKGSFNVRVPSELHREASLKAMELDTSLNSFVAESIRAYAVRPLAGVWVASKATRSTSVKRRAASKSNKPSKK